MRLLLFITLSVISTSVISGERPDLEINAKTHFVCKSGSSLSGIKFEDFCKRNPNNDKILYIYFELSEEILLNSDLMNNNSMAIGSLHNWCTKEIIDPVTGYPYATNPTCVLSVQNKKTKSRGVLNIQSLRPTSNIIAVNIASLNPSEDYYFHLEETSSATVSKPSLFKKLQ